jgi:predicted aspartyl protease
LKRKPRRKAPIYRGTARSVILAVVLHIAAAAGILYYTGYMKVFIGSGAFSTQGPTLKPDETNGSERYGKANRTRWPLYPEGPHGRRLPESVEQTTYFWTDENGIRNFSNLPPPQHVENFEVRKEYIEDRSPSETRVFIDGNRVLVPVQLGYHGNEISTLLVLDTGATTTVLHREAASALHMRPHRHGSSRVADGRLIRTDIADLDYIVVGPHRMKNFTTGIVDHQGAPESSKGLLGMNFLRNVIYHVDFRREVISWENLE